MSRRVPIIVIPAEAGIHFGVRKKQMGSGFRRNDGVEGSTSS
jgi:hypothetical protein